MITRFQGPLVLPLIVMSLWGCSNSSTSGSSGCSGAPSSAVCDIDTTATTCPGEITLECHDGAKPDATTQCTAAIKQDDEVVYCCTNNADPGSHSDDAGDGGAAGAGGAGGGGFT